MQGCPAEDWEEGAGLPYHWFRVTPGASGSRADEARIRKTVKAHGGKVLFIGVEEKGKCFVLLNMSKVRDPKKLRAALKEVAGPGGVVLKTPAEVEKRPRRSR
jgi:hypothetical protein